MCSHPDQITPFLSNRVMWKTITKLHYTEIELRITELCGRQISHNSVPILLSNVGNNSTFLISSYLQAVQQYMDSFKVTLRTTWIPLSFIAHNSINKSSGYVYYPLETEIPLGLHLDQSK